MLHIVVVILPLTLHSSRPQLTTNNFLTFCVWETPNAYTSTISQERMTAWTSKRPHRDAAGRILPAEERFTNPIDCFAALRSHVSHFWTLSECVLCLFSVHTTMSIRRRVCVYSTILIYNNECDGRWTIQLQFHKSNRNGRVYAWINNCFCFVFGWPFIFLTFVVVSFLWIVIFLEPLLNFCSRCLKFHRPEEETVGEWQNESGNETILPASCISENDFCANYFDNKKSAYDFDE